jgi:dTMP kinase
MSRARRLARRGTFVVVEGLDGVGKSTVAARLAERLGADLLTTPPARLAAVRPAILAALADSPGATTLFYAAGTLAVSREVERALSRGRAVVVDRYFLSTCAYGRVIRGGELPAAALDAIARELVAPDVTVYLHAGARQRLARLKHRARITRIGHEDRRTLDPAVAARLDAAYRDSRDDRLAGRFLPVDTSDVDVEGVVERVLALLDGGAP